MKNELMLLDYYKIVLDNKHFPPFFMGLKTFLQFWVLDLELEQTNSMRMARVSLGYNCSYSNPCQDL
jgi:hypothetical protein